MAGHLKKFLYEIDAMPASEFYEWLVYEKVEPFGERRLDLLNAMLMALIANVNRTSRTSNSHKVEDFILQWETKPVVEQSPDEQLNMMLYLQAKQNGIVNG